MQTRGMLKGWRPHFQKSCSPRSISNWLTASGTNELSWILFYDPPPFSFFNQFQLIFTLHFKFPLCVWIGDNAKLYFIGWINSTLKCIAHTSRSGLKQVWKQIVLLTCSYLTNIGDCREHRFGRFPGVLLLTLKICLAAESSKSCVVWACIKTVQPWTGCFCFILWIWG